MYLLYLLNVIQDSSKVNLKVVLLYIHVHVYMNIFIPTFAMAVLKNRQ